jgi:hypothetical protein
VEAIFSCGAERDLLKRTTHGPPPGKSNTFTCTGVPTTLIPFEEVSMPTAKKKAPAKKAATKKAAKPMAKAKKKAPAKKAAPKKKK